MIATLLWKEYREQRGAWMAVAFVAGLLGILLSLLATTQLGALGHDPLLGRAFTAILYSMLLGYGAICGAQVLAGEKERGTLDFLDAHLGKRLPAWRNKLAAGCVLVGLQAFWLAGLGLLFHAVPADALLLFPFLALEALAWGLVGGAYCRSVLPAVLVGVTLAIGSSALTLFLVPTAVVYLVVKVVSAVAAFSLARAVFCAPDQTRRLSERRWPAASSWDSLIWLTYAQGKHAWLLGVAGCFVGAAVVAAYPFILWPAVSLLIGLLCGLAVFGFEQVGEQERFLGAQRFPPGRLWLVKQLCCFGAAVAFTLTTFAVAFELRYVVKSNDGSRESLRVEDFMECFSLSMGLPWFIVLWALHGYCLGQFFTLLTRRIVVGLILAAGTSLLMLALWTPSLIVGGLSPWLMLPAPLAFLLASRLAMWPWLSGRLFTRRSVLVGVLGGVGIAGWVAGVLAFRILELPDVGEPFDLREFHARLDQARAKPVNRLLQQALHDMDAQRQKATLELGPPRRNPFSSDRHEKLTYDLLCAQALEHSWPMDDEEISRWLDTVMAGPWVGEICEVARMEPGLFIDARRQTSNDFYKPLEPCRRLGALLAIHALRAHSRGDDAAALADIETLFGLSCQFGNLTPMEWFGGVIMQNFAQQALEAWMHHPEPKRPLLSTALAMVQQYERKQPSQVDAYKAGYFVMLNDRHDEKRFRGYFSPLAGAFLKLPLQTPWESERLNRTQNALFQQGLREIEGKLVSTTFQYFGYNGLMMWQAMHGGRRLEQTARLRAAEIQLAVMLHRADRGSLPAKLDDLVPVYLTQLPVEDFGRKPFGYFISAGDEFDGMFPNNNYRRTRQIPAGHGVLWYDRNGVRFYFPIPQRAKMN